MNKDHLALVKIIQAYDGDESIAHWVTSPYTHHKGTYERLLSHAKSLGMQISIVPENSKLKIEINVTTIR